MTDWTRWTDADLARLLALRARGDNWDDIAKALGRTSPACQVKFRAHAPAGTVRKRRGRRVGQAARQAPLAPTIAVLPQASQAQPSARHCSTAVLVADAELRARIALQGLTAGLMGDPMPGRSALDKRRAPDGGGNG